MKNKLKFEKLFPNETGPFRVFRLKQKLSRVPLAELEKIDKFIIESIQIYGGRSRKFIHNDYDWDRKHSFKKYCSMLDRKAWRIFRWMYFERRRRYDAIEQMKNEKQVDDLVDRFFQTEVEVDDAADPSIQQIENKS